MPNLDINTLIDFLNDKETIKIEKKKILIDNYKTICFGKKTYDNLIKCILYIKKQELDINIIKQHIQDKISNLNLNEKKKNLNFINNINNDNLLILLYIMI